MEINERPADGGRKEEGEHQPQSVDLSQELLMAIQGDFEAQIGFDDRLRTLRDTPKLTMTIDWADLSADPNRTQGRMRWLKALKERSRWPQERTITIRGTAAEHAVAEGIEANVLSCGVEWQ